MHLILQLCLRDGGAVDQLVIFIFAWESQGVSWKNVSFTSFLVVLVLHLYCCGCKRAGQLVF